MTSPSSPRKNAEPPTAEAVARLLRNGSLHEASRLGVTQDAECLVSHGLIKTVTAEYVRCATHRDPDYRFVRNRSCRGRIRIDDADVDGDDVYCPECGRRVYPRGKARCRMMQIEMNPDGVATFLEGLLKEGGLECKQIHPWVWRVDTSHGEAKIIVADYCGSEYVCRDWAIANRACYVVADAASCRTRFLPEPWLTWTRLADVVCNPAQLTEFLSSAAATVPTSQVRASVPVYSAAVRPVVLDSIPQEPSEGTKPKRRASTTCPDPLQHTTAKYWTTKDGAFCLSTKTQGRYDGKVEFRLWNGAPTKQMQLMKVLCFEHPNAVPLAKLIEQVYPESTAKVRKDGAALTDLLRTLRTLVSDIRNKKLALTGINPDVLPPLDIEVTPNTSLGLRLAHARDMDAVECDESAEDRHSGANAPNHLRRHRQS